MEQEADGSDTAMGKASVGGALIRVHGTCATGQEPARGAALQCLTALSNSRLSDTSQALVCASQRWKQWVFTDSALVGAGQRWWALIQLLLQLSARDPPVRVRAFERGRGPVPAYVDREWCG